MSPASYVYRTFPPEVVSNTHDFDVRWVVHNGQRMRGVFARRAIGAPECSLYMGTYPGHRTPKEKIALKVARYTERHAVDRNTAIRKVVTYTLSLKKYDPGYVLDPTDDQGCLLPEFIPYLACYVNEPPPESPTKAAYVYNYPRQRYEVWLLTAVEQDEEVFAYYGSQYARNYPINSDACDGRFSHFIPLESVFNLDRRGIPAPLQGSDVA